ncbi:peptide ABC transporter substrate-binding protein [Lactobacillus sp. DCY120]|uniref:Peptide ABC transporter substrate-binding protein n=1 Tax=Bombilactobacillus apium TaxID=2675299 RepID=A0A850R812_9LACO|nr:peptide ABC transporter substrate-binding protein [Bombilactobacillus apium]NVY96675.1 peptide ABC transporter substrate-binding protein [Bombilactobacillus apium]
MNFLQKQVKRPRWELLLLLMGLILGGFLVKNTPVQAQSRQVLHLSATAPLDTIDLAKASGYGQTGNVFEGLYRLGKKGQVTAGLAQKSTKSADGLTWTFKLRPARWSNGDKITAQDFVYSWRRTINPKTKAQYAYLFAGIKNAEAISLGKTRPQTLGIKALDDQTLEVQLDRPIAYFKILMAYPLFAPQNQRVVKKYGSKFALTSSKQVYSGPFKITGWSGNNNTWQFTKNPYYWDRKKVKLQKIKYSVVPDSSTSYNLYQTGKLDLILLSSDQVRNLKSSPDMRHYPYSMMYFIKYNFQNSNSKKKKILNNKQLRLAIAQAVNRRELTQKVLGDGSLIPHGFVPQGLANDPQSGKDFAQQQKRPIWSKYNAKQARSHWRKGLRQTGYHKVQLTLLASSDEADNKMVTQYLKAQLEKTLPGLTINLRQMPSHSVEQAQQAGRFDLALAAWGADFNDPISFLQIPLRKTAYNTGKYANSQYDHLINQAQNADANDPHKRWQDLLAANKLLSADQGFTPLYQNNANYLQKKKIHGIIHNTAGTQWNYKTAYLK